MHALLSSLERHPIFSGWIGTATAAATVSASAIIEGLDIAIRISTGVVGLLAAVLSVVVTWRRFRRDLQRDRK